MEIDIQSIVAVSMLVLVLVHFSNKYVVKPMRKKEAEKEGCGPDCTCH